MRPLLIRSIILLPLLLGAVLARSQGVGINNPTPHTSALLDLTSTNKGLLTPRMSTAQRTAIASPATGLLVFDTTVNSFYYYNGVAWVLLSSGPAGWGLNGNAGTNPAVNFIGTLDLVPLNFKVGMVRAGTLDFTNTFMGWSSGGLATTGTQNSFFGVGTGAATTSGNNNVFIGHSTGTLNTQGARNTAVGSMSTTLATTAVDNTCLGFQAGVVNTGGLNTFIGSRAGQANLGASNNVFVGYQSGLTNTTGTNNTYIGAGTGSPANLTNASALGYNAQVTASNSLVLGGTGASAVNVGVGTTAPSSKLHVMGSSAGYAPNANSALTVEAAGNVYASVLSGAGETGLLFGSNANAANGGVLYNSGFTPNGMQLRTGGNVPRLSISSAGDVTIGDNTLWPGYKLGVVASQPTAMAALRNLDATGYSGFHFYNNTNVARAHMGVGNSASPNWVNMGYAGTYTAHPFVLTTSDIERVRIDAAGNVGIGTTAPTVKLDLVDGSGLIAMRVKNTVANGYSLTQYINNANLVGHVGWGNSGSATFVNTFYVGTNTSAPLVLTTGDVERARLDAAGNLGIGTNAPSATLEVNGFSMLGSNAPAVKMLKLTGTTSAVQGGVANVPHGLLGSKILAVHVVVEYAPNNFIQDGVTNLPGYLFNVNWNTGINVINVNGNSAFVLSKPFKALIIYEQ